MLHGFLFGAGASYCSGRCEPERPPLGNQLYDKLEPTLRVAKEVDDDVKELFRKDFEAGMDELLKRKSWVYQSFQQDLARYIAQFEPGPGNHYRELIQIFKNKGAFTLLSTLNYDLLLERAIVLAGHQYTHMLSEPWTPGSFPVYKLHGSCNIVPVLQVPLQGFVLDVRLTDAPPGTTVSGVAGDELRTLDRVDLMKWLDEEDTLVPCVAAYHASKNIRDHGAPFEYLRAHWAKDIHNTEAMFIVGVRLVLHDTHIWEPLSKYKGKIYWISRDPTPALDWADTHGVDMEHFATDFHSFIPEYNKRF
jgi:hypothetical protein